MTKFYLPFIFTWEDVLFFYIHTCINDFLGVYDAFILHNQYMISQSYEMVLLAVNESRSPVTTSSYFGKPAPLLAYPLRIHKYYVTITIWHILVITNKTVLCTIGRVVKISWGGSKYRYDILTPGSKYRTIYWPWGQYIGGSKYRLTPASDKPHTFKSCFTHSSQVFFGRPGPFLPGTGLDLTLFISPLERMTCPNHLSPRFRTRTPRSHIPSLAYRSSIDGSIYGLTPQIQRIIARSLRHSRWRALEVMGQVSVPCNIELRILELNRRPLRRKAQAWMWVKESFLETYPRHTCI